MSDDDALRSAFRSEAEPTRRERRAQATLAYALSPARIFRQVLLLPVVVAAVTISVYIRTSPYDRPDALRHLAAMAGCETARSMGLAPARVGEIGYHARNDQDGDGVACDDGLRGPIFAEAGRPVDREEARPISGAKFVRPTN